MSSIVIRQEITRVRPEICETYRSFSTPILADASGTECAMDFSIKPIKPGFQVIGPAVTVLLGHHDNLLLHKALEMAEPGDVLVVAHPDVMTRSVFGEIMSTVAKKKGVAGLVVDGLVRDIARCQSLGFPIFARGAHPVVCDRAGRPGTINLPVRCGGLSVDPGDLVFGDDDGVVVIPKGEAESVANGAAKKVAAEESRMRDIEQGDLFPAWLKTAFDDIPTSFVASPK